ncbi:YczE/YyaS/YitT family protein [Bacillus sp. 2205SS5-2]|uniref:YczE/YyaS/YitT family protein n=1 Tax=Bacillus sp. 2205SS5-2 TaxID=3109031 RepID=UPI0030043754
MNKEQVVRWSFFIGGLLILALGIALTIKGKMFGIGPWDVFHYGLFLQLGLTIGSWSIIVGLLIISVTAIFTKKWPKMGAWLNMLLMGLFIDMFLLILPDVHSVIGQAIVFCVGLLVLGYGIGLYVSADFGAGPRDSLMLLLVEKTGWSVKWVRNAIEIVVFLFGWLLGGPVGIGTIVIAFLLGTIINYSLPQSKSFLHFCLIKWNAKTLSH